MIIRRIAIIILVAIIILIRFFLSGDSGTGLFFSTTIASVDEARIYGTETVISEAPSSNPL